jgi:hypothetical protein
MGTTISTGRCCVIGIGWDWMGIWMGVGVAIIITLLLPPHIIHLILTDIRPGVTPPVYVQRGSRRCAASYWYYCRNPEGYYPSVKECSEGYPGCSPAPTNSSCSGENAQIVRSLALCSFSACVSILRVPVLVLPGSGRALEFRRTTCVAGSTPPNRWAGSVTESAEIGQQRYDTTYMQCMLSGHRVPFGG